MIKQYTFLNDSGSNRFADIPSVVEVIATLVLGRESVCSLVGLEGSTFAWFLDGVKFDDNLLSFK